MNTSDIVIYQADNGLTSLQVRLDQETVWLSLNQMVELFGRDKSVISRHIHNIFRGRRVDAGFSCCKFCNNCLRLQNLSSRSLQPRRHHLRRLPGKIPARHALSPMGHTTLRAHIVDGFTLNEQRLTEESTKLRDMRQTMDLLARTLSNQALVTDMGKDVLKVIDDYAYALILLDRYDHGTLAIEATSGQVASGFSYEDAFGIVTAMKTGFNGLFGIEKDQGFKSALGAIYQTFNGDELYPSAEEKAANLLYLIIKNHAFSDGNKRIAAAVFIAFLARAGILYRPDGGKRLADNALVALTLLIA